MSDKALEDVRGKQIAMIFQDPMTSLNPTLTIGTQITETIRRHLGLSKAEADKRADRASSRRCTSPTPSGGSATTPIGSPEGCANA